MKMSQSDQVNKIPETSQLLTDPIIANEEVSNLKNSNLTARTFNGLKWSYLDTGINAVLQIGYTAVMARLLSPADFGLVAMANVVLRFGSYFAQMGMGSALVQKKDLSEKEIRAGFTSNVFLSVLMFAIFWFGAPLSTYIFNNQAVVPIVRWLALSFIFTGISTTAISLLRRELNFRSIAIIHIISFILGYAGIGIVMALNGFGVYSLVGAALSQGTILAVLAYLFSRHNLLFVFKWKYYKQLYSFGARVSIISFMEFISSNLDTMAIGRFLGDIALGFYNRAFMLINLPMYYLVNSLSRVLMPSYSRIQDDIPRLRKTYLSSILLVSSIIIPLSWGLSAASNEVINLVLGRNWGPSIPILQILALTIPFYFLSHLAAIILEATAKLSVKIFIQIISIILLIFLFVFLFEYGIIGFTIAVGISKLIEFFLYLMVIKSFLEINFKEIISNYSPGILIGTFVFLTIYILRYFLSGYISSNSLIFLIEIFLSGIIILALFVFSGFCYNLRKELRERFLFSGSRINENSFFTSLLLYIFHENPK